MGGVRVCLIAAVVISQSGAAPPTGTDSNSKICKGVKSRSHDSWCNKNCNHTPSYCPATYCKCSTVVTSEVKCGKCYREAWCGYNQMVTASSCEECPLNKGSWYCAGGNDCRVKGTKPYKR